MSLALERDEELSRWVYGVLHDEPNQPGDFLKNMALAASRADIVNYQTIRPALLVLAAKYPEYKCTCK